MKEIKIITEATNDSPFYVIYKPSGIPSAPLNEMDRDSAFSQLALIHPEVLSVKGKKEIEHGLIHRIDTDTEGVLLVAVTQAFYDYMLVEQAEGRFIKYYKAECMDFKDNLNYLSAFPEIDLKKNQNLKNGKPVEIESFFRSYGPGKKEVRPVTDNSSEIIKKKIGKKIKYLTKVKLQSKNENTYIFICKINSGFRHQVRCHLAWLGFPIIGDKLYNSNKTDENMKFKAIKIEFSYNNKNYSLGFDQ